MVQPSGPAVGVEAGVDVRGITVITGTVLVAVGRTGTGVLVGGTAVGAASVAVASGAGAWVSVATMGVAEGALRVISTTAVCTAWVWMSEKVGWVSTVGSRDGCAPEQPANMAPKINSAANFHIHCFDMMHILLEHFSNVRGQPEQSGPQPRCII
jgi:hypothetical protein